MKKESFGLSMVRLILNVSFIIYLGLVLGLVFLVYFAPAKLSKEIKKINKTEELAPAIIAADPEQAFYINKKYGFEFKYPKDWRIDDVTDEPFYGADEGKNLLMLEVYSVGESGEMVWVEIKEGSDTSEAINGYIDSFCTVGGAAVKEEKIMVGDLEGKAVYFNDLCSGEETNLWVFATFNSNTLVLGNPMGLDLNNEDYSAIVSGFKFEKQKLN